ncbi:hypothetical protein [Thermostichus sp. MS-CIW-25]
MQISTQIHCSASRAAGVVKQRASRKNNPSISAGCSAYGFCVMTDKGAPPQEGRQQVVIHNAPITTLTMSPPSRRRVLGKPMVEAGHGQFLNSALPWVGFKRGKAGARERAAGTSQECPAWGEALRTRWYECSCGCWLPRDVAGGMVLRDRVGERGEVLARGTKSSKAPGEVLAGMSSRASGQDSVKGESPATCFALAG